MRKRACTNSNEEGGLQTAVTLSEVCSRGSAYTASLTFHYAPDTGGCYYLSLQIGKQRLAEMKQFGSGKAPDYPGRSVAKSLPARRRRFDPGVRKILGKETVTHSSILVGNPTSRGAWGYGPGGSERVRHNSDAKQQQSTGWDLNQGLLDFKVMLPTAHKVVTSFRLVSTFSPQPELSAGFTSITPYIWAKRRVT